MSSEAIDPPTAVALPPERQQRLVEILDEYLVAAEQGRPIRPDELLARHPDDAIYLREYLSGLQLFHGAAGAAQAATSGSNWRAIWSLLD